MFSYNLLSHTPKTDCCFCQIDAKEELTSPPTRYECSSNGYSMITKKQPQFQAVHQLPIKLDPSRLDGGSIENTLRQNSAKYHKNCHKMFDSNKLECAAKRAARIQNDTREGHSKMQTTRMEVQWCFLYEKM